MGGIAAQLELEQVLNVASVTRTTAFCQFILIVVISVDLIIMVVVDNNNTAAVMIMTVASRVIQLLAFVVCLVVWPIHVQIGKLP